MENISSNKHDYAKLGMKAGLEVHQQLDTGKLFMRTPSKLVENEEPDFTIERKLRPVPSELGEYDKTALDAFKRNETFYYSGKRKNISLVELDEEPPQPMDEDAFNTALEVALLFKAKPVNKLVTMRKTVIDGSNTSAFQRTGLLALGGHFEIEAEKETETKAKNLIQVAEQENKKKKKIGVQTIILEEDAARPIKKEQGKVYYNLDRLGIPLIELATAPDMRTPEEVQISAGKIGEIMRLTCKMKRGKGTIRQDVNVSIAEGARCEIKGCQELEMIGKVVEKEVERQLDLLALKQKLSEHYRVMNERHDLFDAEKEVTKAFEGTECKFIKGKKVFGLKIRKGKGLLAEKVGARRFGSELSAYAKASGVTGIMHRDELPAYGISEKEVDGVCYLLGCEEKDNFVIIVAEQDPAVKAFTAVKERFMVAFEKIPSETRGALEDNSSEYQRPLSGEARMYPETDLLQREITEEMLMKVKKQLPLGIEERIAFYEMEGLSTNHINEMKLSNYARFFEELVGKGVNAKVAAVLLLQTLTELRRSGINTEKVKLEGQDGIEGLLIAETKGEINKNSLGEAVTELAKGKTLSEVITELKGAVEVGSKAVEKKVIEVVNANSALIKARGMGAIGALMGDLMKIPELKGIDGKLLSELLRKEIMARK